MSRNLLIIMSDEHQARAMPYVLTSAIREAGAMHYRTTTFRLSRLASGTTAMRKIQAVSTSSIFRCRWLMALAWSGPPSAVKTSA